MPSHGLSEDQWQRACALFFEQNRTIGQVASELNVPVHWLTGGDSLVGYALQRQREAQDTSRNVGGELLGEPLGASAASTGRNT